jgi:hypothetical protein
MVLNALFEFVAFVSSLFLIPLNCFLAAFQQITGYLEPSEYNG